MVAKVRTVAKNNLIESVQKRYGTSTCAVPFLQFLRGWETT